MDLMENTRKAGFWKYCIPLFIACIFWNMFTTVVGTSGLLGGTVISFVFSLLVTAIINFMYLRTDLVIEYIRTSDKDSDSYNIIARRAFLTVWILCSLYDFYTTFAGTRAAVGAANVGWAGYPVLVLSSAMIIAFSIFAMSAFYDQYTESQREHGLD